MCLLLVKHQMNPSGFRQKTAQEESWLQDLTAVIYPPPIALGSVSLTPSLYLAQVLPMLLLKLSALLLPFPFTLLLSLPHLPLLLSLPHLPLSALNLRPLAELVSLQGY